MANPYEKFGYVGDVQFGTDEEEEEDENPYAQFGYVGDVQAPEGDAVDPLKVLAQQDPKLHFARAAQNFPGDVKEAATNAWDAITNPRQTLESIGGALSASRTGVSPQTAMGIIESGKEFAKDPVETMVQNPFDTLMAVTGGRGMPIRGVTRGFRRGMGAVSDELYRADMDIPKTMLDEGKEIAQFGARQGITPTRKGLKTVNSATEALNEQLNTIIADSTQNLNMIPKSVVVKHFDDLMRSYENTPGGAKNIAIIKQKKSDFLRDFGNRRNVTAQDLHDFKTSAYEQSYERAARGQTAEERIGPETKALRQAGRGAKEGIEARVPEYGPINEQWASFAKLKPYVEGRVDAPKAVGIGESIKKALLTMTPSGSRTAILLRKMADADLANLVQKYSPQQVKYMLSKVNADNTAAALWAAGQYDQLLKDEEE